MVYEGDGKLMTVLLILVIMLMLLVIPCEPIPLSFKPCRYSIWQGPFQNNGLRKTSKDDNFNFKVIEICGGLVFFRVGSPGMENDLAHELVPSWFELFLSPWHHWSRLLCWCPLWRRNPVLQSNEHTCYVGELISEILIMKNPMGRLPIICSYVMVDWRKDEALNWESKHKWVYLEAKVASIAMVDSFFNRVDPKYRQNWTKGLLPCNPHIRPNII